jgi:F-box-like
MSAFDLQGLGSALPPDIEEKLRHLHELDKQISEMESELNVARQQRDSIYRSIERFRQSRAPIRRVPREILAMIFGENSEEQPDRNFILMRVCRLWYDILMHTPRLWNNIVLHFVIVEDLPQLLLYSNACLTRSGTLPLNIHIDARGFRPEHPFEEVVSDYWSGFTYAIPGNSGFEGLFGEVEDWNSIQSIYERSLLMVFAVLRGDADRFMSRWKTFLLETSEDLDPPTLFRLWNTMNSATDNLTQLEFLGCRDAPSGWRPRGFPSLNSLTSFATNMEMDIKRVAFPVASLEELVIFNPDTSDYFLSFASSKFQSLRLLELCLILSELNEMQGPSGDIQLPALRALALSGYGCQSLIRRFDAPNLTHLSIKSSVKAVYIPCPALRGITDLLWDGRDPVGRLFELRSLVSSASALKCVHLPNLLDSEILETLEKMKTAGRTTAHWSEDRAGWPYMIPRDW